MKKRVLQVKRISEERLAYLLTHVQWLCMKENRYFIVVEEIDWYVVLLVLCEKGVITNQGQMPFKAFYSWIKQHDVPLYECEPNPKRLSYIGRKVSDAAYPWERPRAPKYAVKKWEALYKYFGRMVEGEILSSKE
jgi:hypothetical protein